MIYTLDDWKKDVKELNACRHSILGSCVTECPSCKTYGFYCPHEEGTRRYRLCKWCGFGQDVGGEPFFCKVEACPNCFDDEKLKSAMSLSDAEKKEQVKLFNIENYSEGVRITQSPGHPCPKCGATMRTSKIVDDWHYSSFKVFKDEIYEIHQYGKNLETPKAKRSFLVSFIRYVFLIDLE